jgi:hypothetical protein
MPSRSSRSHGRTSSKKKHKKSHKRSRKSSNDGSPRTSSISKKKEEVTNGNDNNSFYKLHLPSIMLPPASVTELKSKEDELSVKPSPGDESSSKIFN